MFYGWYKTLTRSKKIIIDGSNTGSGKTTSIMKLAEQYNPVENRVVLLTKSVPAFDRELPENMIPLIGRFGCVNNEGKEEGNCIYGDYINKVLMKNNQNIKHICCEHCKNYSNTYELMCSFKKMREDSKTKHIVTTPYSYEPRVNDILVIDESIYTLPLFVHQAITLDDINSVLKKFNSVDLEVFKINGFIDIFNNFINLLNKISTKLNELETQEKNYIDIQETKRFFESYFKNFATCKEVQDSIDREFTRIYGQLNKPLIIGQKENELELNFIGILLKFLFQNENYGANFENRALNITYVNSLWLNYIQSYKNGVLKQIILLDSTVNKPLLALFKVLKLSYKKVKFSIKKQKPKIIQFTDYAWTKTHTKALGKIKKALDKIINKADGQIGIITFSNLVSELEEFKDKAIIGYWGKDNRNTNKFEDCTTLVLIGKFTPSESIVKREVEAFKQFIPDLTCEIKPKLIKHSNSNLAIVKHRNNELIRSFFLAELYQACGRIGRGDNNHKEGLEIFIFTNEPTNLPVDKYLTINDYLDKKDRLSQKQKEQKKSNRQERNIVLEKTYKKLSKKCKKITISDLQKKAKVNFAHAKAFLEEKNKETSDKAIEKPESKILPDSSLYNNKDLEKDFSISQFPFFKNISSDSIDKKPHLLTHFDSTKRLLIIDNCEYTFPNYINPDKANLDYILSSINSEYKTSFSIQNVEIELSNEK